MAPIVALSHRTSYRYDRPVLLGAQTVRLHPAPHNRTPILRYALNASPAASSIRWLSDPSGNRAASVLVNGRAERFEVLVELIADLSPLNPFDFILEPEAARWPFRYPPVLEAQLAPFLGGEPPGEAVRTLAAELGAGELGAGRLGEGERDAVELLLAANALVHGRLEYRVRPEPGIQSPAETLAKGSGSCRDSAWLLVHLLRCLGVASRFCSGYLVQLADAEKPDRADLHAWAEAWLPGAGWIGLDATSGLLAAEGHIPLAAAPEPHSVAPVSGRLEAAEAAFSFELSVSRPSPRAVP